MKILYVTMCAVQIVAGTSFAETLSVKSDEYFDISKSEKSDSEMREFKKSFITNNQHSFDREDFQAIYMNEKDLKLRAKLISVLDRSKTIIEKEKTGFYLDVVAVEEEPSIRYFAMNRLEASGNSQMATLALSDLGKASGLDSFARAFLENNGTSNELKVLEEKGFGNEKSIQVRRKNAVLIYGLKSRMANSDEARKSLFIQLMKSEKDPTLQSDAGEKIVLHLVSDDVVDLKVALAELSSESRSLAEATLQKGLRLRKLRQFSKQSLNGLVVK